MSWCVKHTEQQPSGEWRLISLVLPLQACSACWVQGAAGVGWHSRGLWHLRSSERPWHPRSSERLWHLVSTEEKWFFLARLCNQPLEKPLPCGCCSIALLLCRALQLCPSTCLWLCLRSQPAVFIKLLCFYKAGRMYFIAAAIILLSGNILL